MNLRTSTKRGGSGPLDTVVEGTRQRIIAGEYRPGERLPTEPQLQAEWGVSRSVIREAMKILASQGLVRVEQGRGTFVNEIDYAPLRQQLELALLRNSMPQAGKKTPADTWDALLDLRFVLEVGAAERAAGQITAAELEQMRASINSMRSHPGDAPACSADDYDFHYALATATRNPLWPAVLGSLHDLLRQYFELSHHGVENGLNTVREHEAICAALEARDSAGAAQAMRLHLESGERDLAAARAKHRIPAELAAAGHNGAAGT